VGPVVGTFRTSRKRWATIGVVAVAFVAAGVVMMLDGNFWGWVTVAFFGLCLVVAGWQLVSPGRLILTPEGFTVVTLGRTMRYELAKCGVFTVWRNPFGGTRMVVFDYEGSDGRLGRANRRLAGASASLPDTYGMKAEQLARILNDARAGVRPTNPNG
jgi:hypothetical protein